MKFDKNMLKIFNEKKKLETNDDKITAMNEMNDFIIDKDSKYSLGDVYILTHEKKYENSNDSYMYYEIFLKDRLESAMIKTNENFEMQILDEELNNKLNGLGIDFDVNKKQLRQVMRKDKDGKEKLSFAIMDIFNPKEKDESKLKKYYKNFKNRILYNDVENMEVQDEKPLSKDDIQSRLAAEGKNVKNMKLIEDPFFYQMVQDATMFTYCVEYADGSVGVVNSKGQDITEKSNDGSLEVRKMNNKELVESENDEVINTDYVISIRGSSKVHGIVFPIVKNKGNITMEVKDIYDDDEPSFPLDMQYSENDVDIKKMTELDEEILKVLNNNGIENPDEETVKEMVERFSEKGIDEVDEISVLKEYKRVKIEDQNIDSVEEFEHNERKERILKEESKE